MRYRLINGTDLNVSEIALGTWVFGGREWGETDDAVSIKVIQAAYDNGINFIDTAPIYGLGRSEEVVGKAIRSIGVKMIVATKCGLDPAGGAIPFIDLSPAFIRKEVESSLRRLGVDVIDLYQCHWPDKKAPIEDTFGEMSKLVREGKIRYVGVSNFGKDLIERALKIMPIVSEQVRYSVVEREIEAEILPFCKEKNISVLSYGSLGGGLMTGKYAERPDFPKND
ncbi:MAG TPA: aldo/keto reductase, partial [Candidatus Omnitrophota bacterium]|nr:aldo/keto reductase [Candidatus Omnitrophota bacterium]